MSGVHIYYPPGSRNNQQSKLPIKQPTRESRRGEPTPLGSLDSLVAIDISVYAQPELRSSSRVAGSSARWVSADLDKDMTKIRQQDSASKTISSTSSTLSIFRKVDGQNARRHLGRFLSSTSSTSFSKGGVMCGRVRARGRARSEPSPFRETGRRSRRECTTSTQSCDNLVYHAVFSEVDGGRQ